MTIYRDDLERVYALIEAPERWTQNAYALDAAGEPICDDDGEEIHDDHVAAHDSAACWCLWGAAYKCGISGYVKDREYEATLGIADIADFNDTHTHAEVLALLKAAIERAPVRP